MARTQFEVTVRVTRENVLNVWAEDEDEAEEKAVEIAESWSGVIDVEVDTVEEA